jgi:Outer membrane efflux protein
MAGRKRAGNLGALGRWWRPGFVVFLLLAGAFGCTRQFFRKAADKEVAEVLTEKDRYPDWRIEQYHVYPDPRARFADPTNPDRPPMPPDDPAAWCLSPHPQKPPHGGVQYEEGSGYLQLIAEWDEENRAEAAAAAEKTAAGSRPNGQPTEKIATLPQEMGKSGPGEKPGAPENQPRATRPGVVPTYTTSLSAKPDARKPYLLKLEQAVELALINSREYQDARENLYLVALPVTLERFAFAAQLFAAEEAIRQWAGKDTGSPNAWINNSNVGFAKLFSTGALLLFNFANQTVFNLSGGKVVTSQSAINLDLIQPFLQGGGRAVALEPLTQAERNLLYEIRSFARFRKTFYVAIAGGGGGALTGAVFQPTNVISVPTYSETDGLAGPSVLVPGVVTPPAVTGNPGLQVGPGASGQLGLQVALTAPVSGYLSTLLEAAQTRVDEFNISKLEQFTELARAMMEGGDISELQVDQFEQNLLRGRTSLLTDQLQYLTSLDQFKLQLGLPTDLPIELDDTPFRPLNQQFERYEALFREFTAATQSEPDRFRGEEFVPRVRTELKRIFTSSPLVIGTQFRGQISSAWAAWEKLSADALDKQLAGYRDERRALLARQADLQSSGGNLSAAEQERLANLNFQIDLGDFERILREYESRPWNRIQDPQLRRQQQAKAYRYVENAFILVLVVARNERIVQLRSTWPDLAKLCVNGVDLLKADLTEAETAVGQAALVNRLDLMNVRAQVTDAWRQLAIFANALLAPLTVQYSLNSTTPAGGSNPLAFSSSRTTQQLILNTQLPLVRKPQRNAYRASLINLQRQRRILQRAEDQVLFDTRNELRQLRQQEESYRIQQRLVELSYLTVENSLDTFQAPAAPVPAGQAAPDVQTRAAALTTQLITAQTSLYNAQFGMTTIWITYLNTRDQLYRDMELMPLDYRGVWIDDVATSQCPAADSQSRPSPGQPEPAGQRPVSQRPDGTGERSATAQPTAASQGPALEQAH